MSKEMSTESSNNEKLFQELDSYNWEKDAEFQAGLAAILGPNPSPSQLRDLTIRARTFYYARKTNQTIDFDAYKAYLASRSPEEFPAPNTSDAGESTPLPQASPNPTFPTSFADIVALINSGAPIPGIMDIPPTVLADKATQPAASRRKKPWETQEEPIIPEGEGTFGSDRDRIIPQEEVSP
ncbi:hypothetical protein VC83_00748 [Pseudogymnoascus destructans]|uniref:Uncharacterized protein n=2 Tax=Pseudogymnoascus destructans TaxID=655981 RepID=L8G6E0_PSED2|nr:uncharacterized protein VC83_00748 [Pseudogymnoascus destructans]ELR08815.1 hypothetical protein GMDG_03491 [Pseudogymnoascus destructans 20631-21]OAF62659.1 hypothetical protein VC83_00748 [Pseudogymnoascus destructans]